MTILTASRPWQCECGREILPGDVFTLECGSFVCEDCLTKPETE